MKKYAMAGLIGFLAVVFLGASSAQAGTQIPEDPAPEACGSETRHGKACKRWYQVGQAAPRVLVLRGIRFDSGSARIKPSTLSILDRNVSALKKSRGRVRIVGHTDAMGGADANQRLSEARAESVRSYLGAKGVSRQRMRSEGRGESEPVASNDTAEGRSQNRRIEIHLN